MLATSFHGCKNLPDVDVQAGQRWVYSAGFNVPVDLSNTERIDEELVDLERLVQKRCKVALIAHQGGGAKSGSVSLEFVIPYLKRKLGTTVHYANVESLEDTHNVTANSRDGEITLIGNTRLFKGEQENCPDTAKRFAALGNYAVIGGFCKFHRAHASNCGILDYVPGVLSTGIRKEVEQLLPWAAGTSGSLTIGVLGGTKKEKLELGLAGFLDLYDYVIVGGAVLNAVLLWRGYGIGGSKLPDSFDNIDVIDRLFCEKIRQEGWRKVLLPKEVWVLDGEGGLSRHLCEGLQLRSDQKIVDFPPSVEMTDLLLNVTEHRGRIILAGPPSDSKNGHHCASRPIVAAMSDSRTESIVLGGDSVNELAVDGASSTGGGASLHVIAKNNSPILQSLKLNHHLWRNHGL